MLRFESNYILLLFEQFVLFFYNPICILLLTQVIKHNCYLMYIQKKESTVYYYYFILPYLGNEELIILKS